MILQNKYCIGTLVMWYEHEMLEEHIDSCIQMLSGIENPENVTFHYCYNTQEYFETKDYSVLRPDLGSFVFGQFNRLKKLGCRVIIDPRDNYESFFNIARFRRQLNFDYCEKVDYVLWGETDSLFPAQTLTIIEGLHTMVKERTPKFLLTFAYRRNWDASWEKLVHPMYKDIPFVDNDEFVLNNEASEKAYMSLQRMNEINNIPVESINIVGFDQPKADGSCLVISSELIKSGANIPHGIIHNAEDISMCEMAKLVMGDQFVQYHVSNILRVHNRRHPRKRIGILNEDNPSGFCDKRKGQWWSILENASNQNYHNLRQQSGFIKAEDVINQIQGQ